MNNKEEKEQIEYFSFLNKIEYLEGVIKDLVKEKKEINKQLLNTRKILEEERETFRSEINNLKILNKIKRTFLEKYFHKGFTFKEDSYTNHHIGVEECTTYFKAPKRKEYKFLSNSSLSYFASCKEKDILKYMEILDKYVDLY